MTAIEAAGVAAAVAAAIVAVAFWLYTFARRVADSLEVADDAAWAERTATLQRAVDEAAANETAAERRFQAELDALHADAANWRVAHPDTDTEGQR